MSGMLKPTSNPYIAFLGDYGLSKRQYDAMDGKAGRT